MGGKAVLPPLPWGSYQSQCLLWGEGGSQPPFLPHPYLPTWIPSPPPSAGPWWRPVVLSLSWPCQEPKRRKCGQCWAQCQGPTRA